MNDRRPDKRDICTQIERPCADTETDTQEKTPGGETEAEVGAMSLQAEGRQGVPATPKAGRGWKRPPQGLLWGRSPADTFISDFWSPQL